VLRFVRPVFATQPGTTKNTADPRRLWREGFATPGRGIPSPTFSCVRARTRGKAAESVSPAPVDLPSHHSFRVGARAALSRPDVGTVPRPYFERASSDTTEAAGLSLRGI
jgi:hypothetical protein